jgi:hypothetical protein
VIQSSQRVIRQTSQKKEAKKRRSWGTRGGKMPLERIALRKLSQGMVVACYEVPATLRVGRIRSPVKKTSLLGLFNKQAEFDLLYPDQHMQAEDLIWTTYFYRTRDAPRTSGVFTWPFGLMDLTFERATRNLPQFPGWSVHLRMRL